MRIFHLLFVLLLASCGSEEEVPTKSCPLIDAGTCDNGTRVKYFLIEGTIETAPRYYGPCRYCDGDGIVSAN